MFRLDWAQLIPPAFIQKLLKPAPAEDEKEIVALLAVILRHTGGLPLADTEWSEAHRLLVVEKLLHESITSLLKHRYGFGNQAIGVITKKEEEQNILLSSPTADVNHAAYQELEELPVIGPVIAKRIIESRRQHGPFRDFTDLATRIKGLGGAELEKLKGILLIPANGRPVNPVITGDFDMDFTAAQRISGAGRKQAPLTALLEELALYAASNPHPTVRHHLKRDDLEPASLKPNTSTTAATEVEPLTDQRYYPKLLALLDQATKSIDVCMFFMALGGEDHPTRTLLEKLVAKAKQGCRVRVLLDRDDVDDPYGSRFINVEAARFLKGAGIPVRSDKVERLLHSKFVLLDQEITMVGSHNWTNGSFFVYRDLSLLLKGDQVQPIWQQRFDSLWKQGEAFPDEQ